ncbi:tRNA pseudouridine(13) synthase TruD [Sulfobacillus sp. hq2]|uniref:tRNA pseudouridine(13) synthase TruD n=1 Tax=Sulfobacillus TaxID=28033 RepID=UPI000CD13086|nr:tRNA pseudouridine(13) synthase TruD [Sulfobacillus sp. hq2]POB10197.1 hypothetical protein CO251_11115 [Sulfobacillus sp. hq2]
MLNGMLKSINSDFVVFESLAIPQSTVGNVSSYTYLTLSKAGYTTFDAIEILAEELQICVNDIGYAGLKDEDALTEQTISVRGIINWDIANQLSARFHVTPAEYIHVVFRGYGTKPIGIGELYGNCFRIVVRNLTKDVAYALGNERKKSALFLNYYDTQRFGIPNFPKLTHKIGKHLVDNNYDSAFQLLKESGTYEGNMAIDYAGPAKDFFDSLDGRKQTFYRNSFSSFRWNNDLQNIVMKTGNTSVRRFDQESITYVFCDDRSVLTDLLNGTPKLKYHRYAISGAHSIAVVESSRPTVIQTIVEVNDVARDELNNGKWRCSLNFFLPSGCYATMLVKQLLINFVGNSGL